MSRIKSRVNALDRKSREGMADPVVFVTHYLGRNDEPEQFFIMSFLGPGKITLIREAGESGEEFEKRVGRRG